MEVAVPAAVVPVLRGVVSTVFLVLVTWTPGVEGLVVRVLAEVAGALEEVLLLMIVLVREMVNPKPVEVVPLVWHAEE